jgi:hypothetical protein
MRHFHCIKSQGEHKGWRCWFYPFANVLGSHHDKFNIGIEFYPWTDNGLPGISFGLRANDERTIHGSIKIPFLLALYVHIDAGMLGYKPWWRKLLRLSEDRKYDGRNWGIRWSPSYDYDEDGNEIDENGNIIPPLSRETIKIAEDWKEDMTFPLYFVGWIDSSCNRFGGVGMAFSEFVSLKEFEK